MFAEIKNMKMNIQVIHGNNIDVLKQIADNTIDAIVTDAPYGLGKEPNAEELMKDWIEKGYHEISGTGFMGKEWDSFVPQPLFWKEAFRVLKHGGHVLSFFGTRTYDWGVMAMRFAGFEVRDCIQWLYGCLSDDTEILTENGWMEYKHFRKIKKGSILVYNIYNDEYFFEQPEKWNEYTIKDTCYRIESDNTNQIVSRNHRCLVERDGVILFEFAETLAQERQANIPFLESLSKLSESLSDIHERTSNSKESLLQKMFFRNSIQKNENEREKTNSFKVRQGNNMFGMSENILESKRMDKKSKNISLFKKMQWILSGSGLEETRTQGEEGMVKRSRRESSLISNGREKSIVERRNNLSEKEGVLFGSQVEICEMPKGVYSNGEKGRVCSRVPFDYGKAVGQTLIENGMRTSYRPQSNEQRYNESDVVCIEQGTQNIRIRRSYSTTLATITPVEYSGVVFCPTVSTGAFVARRNGKIFLTGNSGFPKSHNIGKAIDKMYGAERTEIIGKRERNVKPFDDINGWNENNTKGYYEYKAPVTDAATQWEGWGSSLKPANEPIVLARKPLEKGLSIAENVLKWGTGGINIDGCRITTNDDLAKNYNSIRKSDDEMGERGYKMGFRQGKDSYAEATESTSLGRFPANLILSHHPECTLNGLKKVKGTSTGNGSAIVGEQSNGVINPIRRGKFIDKTDENGEETIEDWTCHEDCPIKIMDEQSGVKQTTRNMSYQRSGGEFIDGIPNQKEKSWFKSEFGGSSRFFYCAKASKSERNNGLNGFKEKTSGSLNFRNPSSSGRSEDAPSVEAMGGLTKPKQNFHPTVKPVKLMQYLVRLITPPNGKVLDPFCGSGTTGIACKLEGFEFVGIEQDAEYCKIAEARIANYQEEPEEPLKFIEEEDKPRMIQQTLF